MCGKASQADGREDSMREIGEEVYASRSVLSGGSAG